MNTNEKERDPLHQDSIDANQAYREHRQLEQIIGWKLDMFLQPIEPLEPCCAGDVTKIDCNEDTNQQS